MSSARKRRAELNGNPAPPGGAPKLVPSFPSSSTSGNSVPSGGRMAPSPQMTLQQIINITDRRLVVLENFMNESKTRIMDTANTVATPQINNDIMPTLTNIQENLSELYNRFDIVVGEVAELKDTLTKLQTYTLEVNHILMQEKFRNQTDVEIPSTDDICPESNEIEDEVVEAPVPDPQPTLSKAAMRRRKNTAQIDVNVP